MKLYVQPTIATLPTTMELILLVPVLLIVIAGFSTMLSRLSRRLAEIESRLDAISAHLGVQPPPVPEVPDAVLEHLRRGETIQAVRAYREVTGVGLKEAKDVVDDVADRLARYPAATGGAADAPRSTSRHTES